MNPISHPPHKASVSPEGLLNCPQFVRSKRVFATSILSSLVCAAFAPAIAAPISLVGSGTYTQDFDTLISTSSGTWTNDSTIAGWYAKRSGSGTTIAADTGSSTGGNLYSYGSASTTERALGSLGSGNAAAGNFAWGVQFSNSSGSAININSLSYTGEQWRKGGGTTSQSISLSYKISSTLVTDLTPNVATGWTALAAGNFSSPVNTSPGAALNGNLAANRSDISFNPNITLQPGEYLMIRWDDPDQTGSDHGLAIDDLSIAYVGDGAADETPPEISAQSPTPGAIDVALDADISITFDESVELGAGLVRLYQDAEPSDVLIPIGPVTIDEATGKTASFSPSLPLESSKTYYVIIETSAFVDLASPPNGFDGISSPTAWSFTTAAPDVTRPVATLSPADNGTDVLPASDLLITYNEAVQIGAGSIKIRKVTGSVLVEEINVAGSRVNLVGNTLRIDPVNLLDPNTAYEVEVDEGVVSDLAENPSLAIAAGGEWSFTTKALPSVVISQYYEGATSSDRYLELKNLTEFPITLNNYRLAVWSNTFPSDNEGWKSGTGLTDRVISLDGITIPASGHLLITNSTAANPAYAANSADIKGSATDVVTFFDGDDSIVLYSGATNVQANVVDAISVVASEAINTSFYRLTDTPAFTFDIGYSISADLGQAWAQATTAEVDAAASDDAMYLKGSIPLSPPVLATFAIGAAATSASTDRVTLDYTFSGGVPTAYMVSASSNFADATWTSMPGTSPVFTLSAGNGTKTLYFKVKNDSGESGVMDDTIERVSLQLSSSLLITQYYEGTSNNKYVELANASASPIDITGWQLVRWGNAETENWKTTGIATGSASGVIPLSGTLAPGEAIILSNNSAASPVLASNAFINTGLVNHTGNDSYVLYEGAVQSANIRDAIAFTTANEGPDTSFVRVGSGVGFDLTLGSAITAYPSVWAQNTLATVNAATAGQNIHLGTYLDAVVLDYGSWIAGFFGVETDPLIIGFTADPDKDGIANGIEALIDGDPSVAGVFATTELVKAGNTFSFLYPQTRDLPSGVSAAYQWSTDMVTWNVSGATQGDVTVTLADDVWTDTGSGPITYQVVATVTAGTPAKLFVRVLSVNE